MYAKTNGRSSGRYDLLLAVDVEPFRMTKRAKRLPDISNSDELRTYTHTHTPLFVIYYSGCCGTSCLYTLDGVRQIVCILTLSFCKRSCFTCSILEPCIIANLYQKNAIQNGYWCANAFFENHFYYLYIIII